MERLTGRLVDIVEEKIIPAEILIEGGRIASINPLSPGQIAALNPNSTPLQSADLPFILPGFIDSHVHIESSLLIPAEFARLAVVHGTVGTVSDPHEIANVCGLPGVEFMIANGKTVPFHFYFGAPSCVPATVFETSGATLDAAQTRALLAKDEILYLSEMMNFPGVLHKDPEVLEKIAAALAFGKPVDGHAPGLRAAAAKQYIDAGISTDHECFTAEEALDKLRFGMKILIREGSAAKNFDALIGLLNDYPDMMMFCSDDKHPDSLILGHIDRLCARAVARGINIFKVLKAACINPVLHYKLDTGLLRPGDPADLILVRDLTEFRVLKTYIRGQLVAENGISLIPSQTAAAQGPPTAPNPHALTPGPSTPHNPPTSALGHSNPLHPLAAQTPINNFNCLPRVPADFAFPAPLDGDIPVIEALDGQLITGKGFIPIRDLLDTNGLLQSNPERDILKIVVVNRYNPAPIAISFIRNFGLKSGALASSVAHDSHNIVAVGVDDESLCRAVNLVITHRGGLSCVNKTLERILPLPVAGLMSADDGYAVADSYTTLDLMTKSLGCTLSAPFMTLSFMALLVIPHLKLSDLGLFDGDKFALI